MMVPEFRAWDKITKRYYSVETWHMEDEYVDLIESNKSTADPNAKRFWRRISEVILEQSTGLKDVNGKEIYENDIIKVFAVDDPEDYYHAPIKYWIDDNYPAFDIDRQYVPSARWYDANILSTISESGYEKMEVIGNVHENPELLEADK